MIDNIDVRGKKKGQNKDLLKRSGLYFFGNMCTKILNFIFVPIYTYFVSTADMGDYDFITSLIWLIEPLIACRIQDGIFRWILGGEQKTDSILATGYRIMLTSIAISDVIFIVFAWTFRMPHALLFGLILNFAAIYSILIQISRAKQNTGIIVIAGILSTIVAIVSNIICVCWLRQGTRGLLFSMFFSYVIADFFMILAQPDLYKIDFQSRLDKRERREMFLYSIMLLPNSVGMWALNSSDRIVIRIFIDNAANGIYAVAYKFPAIISLIGSAVLQAFTEQAIVNRDDGNRIEYTSQLFENLSSFLMGMILIAIPFTKQYIVFFMEESYKMAWKYTGFLYIGVVYFLFAGFWCSEYINQKRSRGTLVTTLIGCIINVLINVLMIKYIGLHAASLSTMLSAIVMWLVRVIHLRDSFRISIPWKTIICYTGLCITYTFLVLYTGFAMDLLLFAIAVLIMLFKSQWIIKKLYEVVVQKIIIGHDCSR